MLVPFGATFKSVRLSVLYAIEGCLLFSGKCQASRRPYDTMVLTTLIGWDVPRTLTDHWHEIRLNGCISVKDCLLFVTTAYYRPD